LNTHTSAPGAFVSLYHYYYYVDFVVTPFDLKKALYIHIYSLSHTHTCTHTHFGAWGHI
jgi:hypothetical protein